MPRYTRTRNRGPLHAAISRQPASGSVAGPPGPAWGAFMLRVTGFRGRHAEAPEPGTPGGRPPRGCHHDALRDVHSTGSLQAPMAHAGARHEAGRSSVRVCERRLHVRACALHGVALGHGPLHAHRASRAQHPCQAGTCIYEGRRSSTSPQSSGSMLADERLDSAPDCTGGELPGSAFVTGTASKASDIRPD